jgi:hypothetical protein
MYDESTGRPVRAWVLSGKKAGISNTEALGTAGASSNWDVLVEGSLVEGTLPAEVTQNKVLSGTGALGTGTNTNWAPWLGKVLCQLGQRKTWELWFRRAV